VEDHPALLGALGGVGVVLVQVRVVLAEPRCDRFGGGVGRAHLAFARAHGGVGGAAVLDEPALRGGQQGVPGPGQASVPDAERGELRRAGHGPPHGGAVVQHVPGDRARRGVLVVFGEHGGLLDAGLGERGVEDAGAGGAGVVEVGGEGVHGLAPGPGSGGG
jgi:hypothetical protein